MGQVILGMIKKRVFKVLFFSVSFVPDVQADLANILDRFFPNQPWRFWNAQNAKNQNFDIKLIIVTTRSIHKELSCIS